MAVGFGLVHGKMGFGPGRGARSPRRAGRRGSPGFPTRRRRGAQVPVGGDRQDGGWVRVGDPAGWGPAPAKGRDRPAVPAGAGSRDATARVRRAGRLCSGAGAGCQQSRFWARMALPAWATTPTVSWVSDVKARRSASPRRGRSAKWGSAPPEEQDRPAVPAGAGVSWFSALKTRAVLAAWAAKRHRRSAV